MDNKRKILIGAAVGITIVIAIVLLLLFIPRHKDQPKPEPKPQPYGRCQAVDAEPAFDDQKLPIKIANDITAIGKFAGFLKYPAESGAAKNVYMPIQLDSIAVSQADNKWTMNFGMDCAKVDIHFLPPFCEDKLISGDTIEVQFVQPIGDFKSCFVQLYYYSEFRFTTKYHYKCQEAREFDCMSTLEKATAKQVATLTIASLEFELLGDQKKMDKGEFTTPAEECPKREKQLALESVESG